MSDNENIEAAPAPEPEPVAEEITEGHAEGHGEQPQDDDWQTRIEVVPMQWGVVMNGNLAYSDLPKAAAVKTAKQLAKANKPAEVTVYAANGLDPLRKVYVR